MHCNRPAACGAIFLPTLRMETELFFAALQPIPVYLVKFSVMAKAKSAGPASSAGPFLQQLQQRFEKFPERHTGIRWETVRKKLEAQPGKIKVLQAMEDTGGEPDVIGLHPKTGAIIFADCSAESPAGRRSCCYDEQALRSRKENKPPHSAEGLAAKIGIEILSEAEYRGLQQLGQFDCKTSSWVQTPAAIRARGGAVFCDRRYDQVFLYHNGAESYYAARGFRGKLLV